MKKNDIDESDKFLNFLYWLNRHRMVVLLVPIAVGGILLALGKLFHVI